MFLTLNYCCLTTNFLLQFKEITRAHEILSDKEKRDVYDKYGMDGSEKGAGAGG